MIRSYGGWSAIRGLRQLCMGSGPASGTGCLDHLLGMVCLQVFENTGHGPISGRRRDQSEQENRLTQWPWNDRRFPSLGVKQMPSYW